MAPLVYCTLAIALGLRGPKLGVLVFGRTSTLMSSDSAIALLAAVSSGMMALTGIVFSLVFVALQFGTTAYSPRLADELGSQRSLSHGLGIFSGTFLYSILAIRAVDIAGSPGITLVAVVVAFGWLSASVVVMVMLIPQIQTLSIAGVLDRLGRSGRRDVEAIFSPFEGGPNEGALAIARELEPTQEVRHVGEPMYLIGLQAEELVRIAERHGAVLRVLPAVGDPVFPGELLVQVLAGSSPVPERDIRRAVLMSPRRTVAFNPMYTLRLLADIAIRAISPAVNDPTTTVMALDQTHSILAALGASRLDDGLVADQSGALRLEFPLPTWEDALALALTEIELYGGRSPQVQRRLGSLLEDLIGRLPESRHPELLRLVERRQQVIEESFADDGRRAEASAFDRQGLGHTVRRG